VHFLLSFGKVSVRVKGPLRLDSPVDLMQRAASPFELSFDPAAVSRLEIF